jgi:hypothetical protein
MLGKLLAGMLAVLALSACSQKAVGLLGPQSDRQLMARYDQVQGNDLASEAERLQLLKSLLMGRSSDGEAFALKALSSFDAPAAPLSETMPPMPRQAIWSEFLPYAQVIEYLPALKARNFSLLVAVPPEKVKDPTLYELFARAQQLGVEVRPWLLVSAEDGYWANKWNYRQVSRYVQNVIEAMAVHQLRPQMITLDIEPPVSLTQPLAEHLERVDLLGARRLLVASSRDGSLREARDGYGQLVQSLHAQGIRVHAVTTPMVLDDMAVGRSRLQSALGVPVEGVSWDDVTFMAYRTEFLRLAGPLGGDVVHRYAKDAVRFFGARAGMDIGVIGSPGFGNPAPGYTDPRDLAVDLNAVRKAGVGRVNIFSLDGMIEQGGVERWSMVPEASPVKREAKALLLRALIQTVTRTLPAEELATSR